jgi:Leucine-rich repeat (LRR) protein
MSNLQELFIDKNELENIPNEIVYLKYLKKLNIGNNQIQAVQPNLFNN